MVYASICMALAVIVALFSVSGQAASQPNQPEINNANRLFEAGNFAEAGKLYARIADHDPKDYSATLQLGRIALLSNRLDDAQKWLEVAIALNRANLHPRLWGCFAGNPMMRLGFSISVAAALLSLQTAVLPVSEGQRSNCA